MKHAEIAAYVQAAFSLLAIGVLLYQNGKERRKKVELKLELLDTANRLANHAADSLDALVKALESRPDEDPGKIYEEINFEAINDAMKAIPPYELGPAAALNFLAVRHRINSFERPKPRALDVAEIKTAAEMARKHCDDISNILKRRRIAESAYGRF